MALQEHNPATARSLVLTPEQPHFWTRCAYECFVMSESPVGALVLPCPVHTNQQALFRTCVLLPSFA